MNLWSLIPLVSGVLNAGLFLTLVFQKKTRLNLVFAFYIFTSMSWSIFAFLLSYNPLSSKGQLILWNNLLIVAMVGSVFAYYHFVRTFIGKKAGIIVYLGYGLTIVIAGLSLGGWVVRDAYYSGGFIYHDIGPWVNILMLVLLPPMGLSMWMLAKELRNSHNHMERNRIFYLIIGLSVMSIWALINANVRILAELPTDHLGTLANSLLIAWAIRKYDLLDIRLLARRMLEYSLLVLGTLGVYAGLIFFEATQLSYVSLYILLILSGGFSLLLAMLLRPIRFLIQDRIDRLFNKDTYLHRQALLEFSNKVANKIKLDQIADDMVSTIGKALRLTQVDLMLENAERGEYTVSFAYPKPNDKVNEALKLSRDDILVILLRKDNKPINIEDVHQHSSLNASLKSDTTVLVNNGYEFLLPLKSADRMIGIIALGHKLGGSSYYPEDIEMVMNMARQASVVIENAQLYAQAKERANTDELTGLFNHRYFHQRMDEEIARSARFGEVFSLLSIDLDFFKTYNDVHGHLYGDKILRVIAERIKASIRTIDLAFRYGGDEFSVLLPQTSTENAVKVAERIRHSFADEVDNKGMPVSCSIGVACWPTDGVMREEIIQASDSALYHAKQNGKNQVRVASEVDLSTRKLKDGVADTNVMVLNTIYALAATVDAKDHYTYGHSKKVSKYASEIAEALGYSKDKIATIHTAGLLHDIGKIGVSDAILGKRSPLNEEEWEPIHAHPDMGASIIRNVECLKDCLPGIQYHHERYDGTGYPTGLKGDNIPLDARILAVADSFDAMTSERPYRNQSRTKEEALEELIRNAGTQFDPNVVRAFVNLMTTSMALEITTKAPLAKID
jgi:diguanylate cyclase (GGDEF)-like protein/putative nucleotidyltransferase with HDIG domain